MNIFYFFIAHWYLSLFTQTFFHHRYAAHQMFTMNRFWERTFYMLSWVFQGSSFLSPKVYGYMHRIHHAYPDTEKDVHSPKYSKNIFDMMWKTKNIYNDILEERAKLDDRFKQGHVPDWPLIERLGDWWPNRIFWGLVYIVVYWYFDAAIWQWIILLPIQFVMGPFHGAIINWFAHKYGYVNFKVNDTSKNLLPIDFLMWGESYHNNHHKRGNSPNFGVKWWEIDPMYPFILFFNALGIIKLAKVKNSE